MQSLQVSFVDKYPDRVPIILQITEKSKARFSDGSRIKKYLVSKSDHFYHFMSIIRASLKLSKHESLYLFVNNSGLIKAGRNLIKNKKAKFKKSIQNITMMMVF